MHMNYYQQAALRTANPKDNHNEVFHLLLASSVAAATIAKLQIHTRRYFCY
ncbi:MAG TPA: hypothetical protein VF597_02320 [Candidatus Saccharimonadales bacterium]